MRVINDRCKEQHERQRRHPATGTTERSSGRPRIVIEQEVAGERASRPVIIQAPMQLESEPTLPDCLCFSRQWWAPSRFLGQLRRYVDTGRFIAILPTGMEQSWNLGREASQADDLAFVGMIMQRLRTYRNFNFRRLCLWIFQRLRVG